MTVPARRLPLPCRVHSNEDFPEPLRPISAVTVPGRSRSDTSCTASVDPWVTVMPRASRPPAVVDSASSAGGVPSRSRRPLARRRASRTVSGSGCQPAARPSSTRGGATGESVSRSAGNTRTQPAAAVEHDERVGERHHPLEPVLGQHHRDAEVVDEPGQGGEHVLGGGRVEGRGGFVEDQDPRVHGQHRPDGDALLLAAGEPAQVARTQVGDAEQVEGLLDASPHGVGRQAELLHAVGELLLDRVGDETRGGVLADVPDVVGPLARRGADDARAVEEHVAGEAPARESRDEAADDAEQRRLARAGRSGDEHELALVDGEVDVVEHGGVVVGPHVGQADIAQLDHCVITGPPPPGAGPAPRHGRGRAPPDRRPGRCRPRAGGSG